MSARKPTPSELEAFHLVTGMSWGSVVDYTPIRAADEILALAAHIRRERKEQGYE